VEVLTLADDLVLRSLHIASYCSMVINDIAKRTGGRHEAIIQEILAQRSSFAMGNFVHEFRRLNVEDHNLAMYALSLDHGCHVWLGQPHDHNPHDC
jgi:hypothetical protein